jgi:hypothetical protein
MNTQYPRLRTGQLQLALSSIRLLGARRLLHFNNFTNPALLAGVCLILWLNNTNNAMAQSIRVRGLLNQSVVYNLTYTPDGSENGAPRWSAPNPYSNQTGRIVIRSTGSRWEIVNTDSNFGILVAYTFSSSKNRPPCSPWYTNGGNGNPVLSSEGDGCGPDLTLITSANPSTICSNSSVNLSVTATEGTAPYSFTWIAPPGGSITGSGSAVTGSSTATGLQDFTVRVADSSNPPILSTATVSVLVNDIGITSQPAASSLICAATGGSVSVPVSASGAIDGYRWYKGDTPVSGQTSSTLNLSTVTINDTGDYKLVITGGCNSVTTTAFQLVVSETLRITAQPAASSTVCAGGAVSVPASVSGGAFYQWYKGATPVASQTTSTLSLTNSGGSDTGSYSLVATGGCNSVTTSAFSLTVLFPIVTVSPASPGLVVGLIAVPISLTASGAATYIWSPVSSTGAIITVAPVETTVYSVTGTDSKGCSATAAATVSVTALDRCLSHQDIIVTNNQGFVAGTYQPNGIENFALRWSKQFSNGNRNDIYWSGSRWEILNRSPQGTTSLIATNNNGSSTNLPCSGWVAGSLYTVSTLSGGCGPLLRLPVTSVTPSSQTITSGGSATLTASGESGATADSYFWSDGSTGNPLILSNVVSTATYSVTGVRGQCSATATAMVSVTAPPFSFTTAATPTTLCAGGSVALSASTTQGTPPYSYTWIAPPGGSITGSGSAVTGMVSTTASGVQAFTLQAMDSGSPSLSVTQTVSVTVVGATITSQPAASSLACVGGSVSVPVSASGAIDSYLWYKDDAPVQGQTLATLSLSPVTLGDAGTYKLVITGSCNSVTTTAFQLTVSETLGITAQPAASSTVCAGVAVSVPASVSGVGATYQWYKGSTPVASQTTSTLSLTNPAGSDTGSYSLVATGGCNSVTTTAFSLSVIEVGNFSGQPASSSAVCAGGSVSVPTTVTGSVASYQWYKGTTPVTSQTTNTLSLTGLNVGDGGVYRLVSTMTSCGSLTSNAFSLTVNTNPTVTISASPGLAVLPGSSVTLTADGASTYQWSANTDNASVATVVASTTGVYSVTGTAAGCTGTASITLIGLIPPVLSASSSVVCEGSTVMVSGFTPQTVTYQWLKDGVSLGAGYQSATLTLGGLQPAQSGTYALVVTSGGASVTSTGSFRLTVQPQPTVVLIFSGATQSLQGGNLPVITLTNPLDPANLPVFQVLGGVQYERLQQVDRVNGYEIRKSQINRTGVFSIDLLGPYTITVTDANGCSRTVTGEIRGR